MTKKLTTTTSTPKNIYDVWEAFAKKHTVELRNLLMTEYLDVVKYNAKQIHKRLPEEVELNDLVQEGIFGLRDAVESFDLSRGLKFETYCAPRVRGAILDGLRHMDWVPRLVRSRSHKIEYVTKILEMELGRPPNSEEISDILSLPEREYKKLLDDSRPVTQVSLSRKWFETDGNKDVREIDILQDRKIESPDETPTREDLRKLITRGLDRTACLIVCLYYFESLTLKEIGQVLDLCESRVSQLHFMVMERLRSELSLQRLKESM